MTTESLIIKYATADSAGVVGQSPYKAKAKVANIINWEYVDKLNSLSSFSWTTPNDEFHKANAIPERKAFVPFLTPFRGYVTGFAEDETSIDLVAHEFAFHLTRGIFTNDDQQRVIYTDENWYNASWKHRQKYVVNKLHIKDEIKDFPLLINFGANTSFVNNALANGDDFVVTTKDGTTKIPHEIEHYDNVTGKLVLWCKIPKVTDASNIELYIYYDNSGALNQEDIVNVWKDAYTIKTGTAVTKFTYAMVQHLDADSVDSTENNNDGTDTAITYTTTEDQAIGNAAGFDGIDSKIDCGSGTTIDDLFGASGGGWLTAWFNANSDGEGDNGVILDKGFGTAGWELQVAGESGGNIKVIFEHNFNGAANNGVWETAVNIPINVWHRVDVIYDNSSTTNDPTIYIDGVKLTVGSGLTETSTPSASADSDAASNLIIGNVTGQTATFDGEIDEVRLMKTPPPDFDVIITTEHMMENQPTIVVTRISTHEEYKKAANLIAQDILDSANTGDMPVTWTLADGFPTDVTSIGFNLNNHWEALNKLAIALQKDLYFDNKTYEVFIATKGKTLTNALDITITTKPEKNTENFANKLYLVGKKTDVGRQLENIVETTTVLRYGYSKVIADNQLTTIDQLNSVGNTLLSEFQKLTPQIKGEITLDQLNRFNLKSGDIIKIAEPDKDIHGNFRVMEIKAMEQKASLVLESTSTGIIRHRSLSLSDVISGLLKKVSESGIESA